MARIYVLALATIAVLLVTGQYLLKVSMHQEQQFAKGVHAGAVFRTTGLNVLKDLYALDDFKDSGLSLRLAILSNDEARWKACYQSLDALREPDVQSALQPQTRLSQDYARLCQIVDSLSKVPTSQILSALRHNVQEIAVMEQPFEAEMDNLVKGLAFKSEHRGNFIQLMEGSIVLLALLLLFIEGRFLFKPAFQRIRNRVEHLVQSEEEAAAKGQLLERDNERLQADRDGLRAVADNLEASNQRLGIAAKRFEELFQGLPIACLGYGPNGEVFEWNRAAEMLLGDPTKLLNANICNLLTSTDADISLEDCLERVLLGESVSEVKLETLTPGGKKLLLCCSFPIQGNRGQIQGAMLSCVDITAQKEYEWQIEDQLVRINDASVALEQQRWELQQANAKLEALARTDGLTGIANHRAFQESLSRNVKQARRSGNALSVILLDIDFFKKFNDSYGHPAGDAVLKQFSELLVSRCRESDMVARYGGEEFAIILPQTTSEQAAQAAERVMASITGAIWPNRAVTASLGIATFSEALPSPASLISAADKALYASKAAGRNRYTQYSDVQTAAASAA